jgi:LysR family glycine cleavage system transcriptional activator
MRPLVDAGLLVPLFHERLNAEFAHYLVYPPRSENHSGLAAFRSWLLQEAKVYAKQLMAGADTPPPPAPNPSRRRRPQP